MSTRTYTYFYEYVNTLLLLAVQGEDSELYHTCKAVLADWSLIDRIDHLHRQIMRRHMWPSP